MMQSSKKIIWLVVAAVFGLVMIALGVSTLCAVPQPSVSADGFSGPLSTVWQGMIWAGYLLLISGGLLVLFFAVAIVRMALGAVGEVASGIEWLVSKVRNAWAPIPPALDTVVIERDGRKITLGDLFAKANNEIKTLKAQLGEVVLRTAHIEPPPPPEPPKSAEDIAAEQAQIIQELQRELASMKAREMAARKDRQKGGEEE